MSRPAPGPLGLSLGSGSIGALGVGTAATAVSALVGGARGTVSAVAAVVVVLLFFVVSLWLVEVANRVNPSMTLPVGLTVYGTLVLWLGLLAFGTSLPDHLHQGAFAWTVISATLGWLVAQAVAIWRWRIPYVLVDLPTSDPSDEPPDVVGTSSMTERDERTASGRPDPIERAT